MQTVQIVLSVAIDRCQCYTEIEYYVFSHRKLRCKNEDGSNLKSYHVNCWDEMHMTYPSRDQSHIIGMLYSCMLANCQGVNIIRTRCISL